jgi:rhodanese-related sulfurtransferase
MRTISILTLALGLFACSPSASTTANAEPATSGSEAAAHFSQISVAEVESGLAAQNLAVFDANHRETYDEHHVPGATWVDYDEVSAEQLPENHDAHLVFYCANEQCSASHVAAERAAELGYPNVSVMGAGIQGWIEAGKPVEAAAAN